MTYYEWVLKNRPAEPAIDVTDAGVISISDAIINRIIDLEIERQLLTTLDGMGL